MNALNALFKKNNIFIILAMTIFILDLCYSIKQYQAIKIDGDFAQIVLPSEWYGKVLKDPFGKLAIFDGERYQATNRFTAHFIMRTYFYNAPLFLQNFFSPIESLYLSVTIAKTFIHIAFLFLIAYYSSILIGFNLRNLILGIAISTPFLINGGLYEYYLGFNDKAITYSMFYTLPLIWLMFYYLPIYKKVYLKNEQISVMTIIIYIPLTFLIVLSGPLVAPLILLINFTFFTISFFKIKVINKFKISNVQIFYIIGIIFSLYSIYLGTFNVENDGCKLNVIDRYNALFSGLYQILFMIRYGVLFLYVLIILNLFWLKMYKIPTPIYSILLVFFLISIMYLALLPLGGCRDYRPNIIRRDTLLPILVILLFFITTTSLYLIKNKKYLFLIIWFIFSFVFWKSDVFPYDYDSNILEKKNLVQLSHSTDSCVLLNENFPVFSWNNYYDCNESYVSSQLIFHYKISPRVILYKNK